MRIGDGIGVAFVFVAVAAVLGVWAVTGVVDFAFGGDSMKCETLITPTIELVVTDNQIDTIYVYQCPN